jgi:hypothetical protein
MVPVALLILLIWFGFKAPDVGPVGGGLVCISN